MKANWINRTNCIVPSSSLNKRNRIKENNKDKASIPLEKRVEGMEFYVLLRVVHKWFGIEKTFLSGDSVYELALLAPV